MAWGHSTGTSHCITRSGYFQPETLPPCPPLRSRTMKARAQDSLRLQAGMSIRRVQRGDKKGLLSWHSSRQHQRKSCETANVYKAGSGEAPRPWCNDRGVPAAQILLLPSTPQSCRSKPLWTQPLNGSGWKGKHTGKEKENPWEGRVTSIMMPFKAKAGKQHGQGSLRHRGGKEREVGETQSLRGCQSPCFADRVC